MNTLKIVIGVLFFIILVVSTFAQKPDLKAILEKQKKHHGRTYGNDPYIWLSPVPGLLKRQRKKMRSLFLYSRSLIGALQGK